MSDQVLGSVADSSIPGWFGKIPALGDFASRRLPPEFLNPWEDWLMVRLRASRVALGERWHDTFLQAPIWRFFLFPAVCGPKAWTGILMPSVDSVGRHFPLTIALSVPMTSALLTEIFTDSKLYSALDEAARLSLDLQGRVEELEDRLRAAAFVLPEAQEPIQSTANALYAAWHKNSPPRKPAPVEFESDQFADILRETATLAVANHVAGTSLWWAHSSSDASSIVAYAVPGLPSDATFTTMLGRPQSV
jgi:type VI secretion system protein ImpM